MVYYLLSPFFLEQVRLLLENDNKDFGCFFFGQPINLFSVIGHLRKLIIAEVGSS